VDGGNEELLAVNANNGELLAMDVGNGELLAVGGGNTTAPTCDKTTISWG
jgi:hypothetical protein